MKWKHWAMGGAVLLVLATATGIIVTLHRQTAAGGTHMAPPPRLPKELIGEWIQVYPRKGALTRVFFDADSTFTNDGSGYLFDRQEFHPDSFRPTRWQIIDRIVPGSLCIAEKDKPIGDCYLVRLVADTMWFLSGKWPVLVRVRDGTPPPTRAWHDTHLPRNVVPNSYSFRPLTPLLVY